MAKLPKVSQNNMLIVGGLLLLVVLSVVAIIVSRRRGRSESFSMEKTGQYMTGVHGSQSIPLQYRLEKQEHPDLNEYQKDENRDVHITPDKLGELGVQRELGYGDKYHIVGEKAYPCSNDPNDLTKYSCNIDDYSIWQNGRYGRF